MMRLKSRSVLLGRWVLRFFAQLGDFVLDSLKVLRLSLTTPIRFKHVIEHAYSLGAQSVGITLITAGFVGMAFALQVVREFLKFGAGKMIGGVVGIAIWRELGPLMTGVVVAGRVGAAIAAELATMKVTEQVEALEALGHDPIQYLVVPRLVAVMMMMPLLVGLADCIGFLSGYVIAVGIGRINPFWYFESANTMLTLFDIMGGLLKGSFFGILIVLVSAHLGLRTNSGAKGVGEMTTRAVVISLVLIFVLNYVLSSVMF